jgi:hypothetical protein
MNLNLSSNLILWILTYLQLTKVITSLLKYDLPKDYTEDELRPIARRYLPSSAEFNILNMFRNIGKNKASPPVIKNRLKGYGRELYKRLLSDSFKLIY